MLTTAPTAESAFGRLVAIIARLRLPDGCPWDREQTPQSAAPYLLEEAFEAAEAIDSGDTTALCEELGDVLLQVVFQTQMIADTSRDFSIVDVANRVADKMIHRHPHIFADASAKDSAEVLANWEKIKAKEKPHRASMLDGIPKGLPALLRALRLGQKASRVNFDWPNLDGVQAKVDEELREFAQARASGDTAAIDHEFGDLLFSLVQVARTLELDPEGCLRRASDRFTTRFQWMESQLRRTEKNISDVTAEHWEQLWQQAKKATR